MRAEFGRNVSDRIKSLVWRVNDSRAAEHPSAKWIRRKSRAIVQNWRWGHFPPTKGACPRREISTQKVTAKNNAPHTTTGLPHDSAMAGRCDILGGYSHTAFNHDPESADSVMRANNGLRNITNAREAIVLAGAWCAIRTMISRKEYGRY